MSRVSLIVAMDRNRLIGNDNQMPWRLPADLAHFKRVTMGKPMVMGRKTWESLGRVLPGRRHIVVTRQQGYTAAGIEVVSTLEEALTLLRGTEEIMVIGGAQIYAQMLPHADLLYITRIDAEFDGDTWFPKIDMQTWQLLSETAQNASEKNPYPYAFQIYARHNNKSGPRD